MVPQLAGLSCWRTLIKSKPTASSPQLISLTFKRKNGSGRYGVSYSTKHGSELSPLDTTELCLLSFDGGGVRGLPALYILKSIMDLLNHERNNINPPLVKPCEIFDLIGGTGTGGQVDLLLEECG